MTQSPTGPSNPRAHPTHGIDPTHRDVDPDQPTGRPSHHGRPIKRTTQSTGRPNPRSGARTHRRTTNPRTKLNPRGHPTPREGPNIPGGEHNVTSDTPGSVTPNPGTTILWTIQIQGRSSRPLDGRAKPRGPNATVRTNHGRPTPS
ncbi:hypothetical protein CesoFtcFv8_000273 [Champsocephalus esox]|uniref:Uncharacterized protein n=1 Tax=Champsocephalus esox TaxID=159716 RepID=A0AAN8DXL2_9TELE|nr:hypothetical protein CesoFtcFv8_000273 [Champsocephalus esox]